MSARVLRTELRRGAAGFLVVVLVLVVAALLTSRAPRFSGYNSWSSGWSAAAGEFTAWGIVLGPVAATVAAWVGARERRWGLTELLATTPRPRAHRGALTLTALGLAVVLGQLAGAAAHALAVAPTSRHPRVDDVVVPALGVLGVLVATAWGWAVGRLVPRRLTAPLVGLALYAVAGVLSYSAGALGYLSPLGHLPYGSYQELLPGIAPGYAVWLASIAAVVLVAVLARRRRWALVPAATAALAVTVLLLAQDSPDGYPTWARTDPVAARQVCTGDAPVVCVTREHEAFLADVTPLARGVIVEMAPVVTVRGAQEDLRGDVPDGYLPLTNLQTSGAMFRPGLADPDDVRFQTVMQFVSMRCPLGPSDVPQDEVQTSFDLSYVAAGVLVPSLRPTLGDYPPAQDATALRARLQDPAEARAWIGRYLDAVHGCDYAALERLR